MTKKIDSDAIRQLAAILNETGLSEIEYEYQGCRIYIARSSQGLTQDNTVHSAIVAPTPFLSSVQSPLTEESQPIRSPMVGTVYLAPEPGGTPFIQVGAHVVEGQTLLIIEAMKVMNPIKALKSGKVIKIFIHDTKPVEYDEPLLIIE